MPGALAGGPDKIVVRGLDQYDIDVPAGKELVLGDDRYTFEYLCIPFIDKARRPRGAVIHDANEIYFVLQAVPQREHLAGGMLVTETVLRNT